MILMILAEERARNDARIEELILLMADGDTSAMGDLYLLTKTSVYAYALSKTADKELAEDVTHDTFVRVFKYAKQYKPMGKPMAWIMSIELNVIRYNYNKTKRVMLVEDIEREPDERDPIEQMISSDFLRGLLGNLSEEEREIVVLHAVSGLKHREIARLLEIPLSTVLSKYARAIKKLQKILAEEDAR